MSYYDLGDAHPQDLIVSYVLDCRGQGCFLPYSDYHIVGEWLKACSDTDALLLVLSDLLPQYFAADPASGRHPPRTLAGIRRAVLRRLSDQQSLARPRTESSRHVQRDA